MFDQYAAKLKQYQADVPKVFKKVARKTAIKAENTAKELTDKEGLVDTGAYKGAWEAKSQELEKGTYAVYLNNSMDYASHLEFGHALRNGGRWKGRFVGRNTLDEAHFYALEQLDKELEKAIINYHQSFTEE